MQCTPEPQSLYRVLTHAEREEIMIGQRLGKSIRSIARHLNRNPSVISRELKQNSTEDGIYQAYWAHSRSQRRRKQSRKRKRVPNQGVRQYIEDNLKLGWSPEQIAGRIALDYPSERISHETIYQYIFRERRDLTQYLTCGRKRRRKRYRKHAKRTMIPQRVGIEERPKEVEYREEIGHWEADTAVSRQSKEALMVLHERAAGITLLAKLPRCAPQEMYLALKEKLKDLPLYMRRTLTFDNGQENRQHHKLKEELGIHTFFCNAYSSWEKGSVEHAVGLTRRVWPKKTDYALISDKDIAMLEYRLNTRPRKRLGFLTPYEYVANVASTP